MTTTVERKLDSIRKTSNGLGTQTEKKIQLIKRQTVVKEKKDGGLRVRNLKMHDKILF